MFPCIYQRILASFQRMSRLVCWSGWALLKMWRQRGLVHPAVDEPLPALGGPDAQGASERDWLAAVAWLAQARAVVASGWCFSLGWLG